VREAHKGGGEVPFPASKEIMLPRPIELGVESDIGDNANPSLGEKRKSPVRGREKRRGWPKRFGYGGWENAKVS